MFRMHTAHLANVRKSVTKNATFPRTGGLPCLITWQLHLLQLLGDSFFESQQPPSWDPCSHYSMDMNDKMSWKHTVAYLTSYKTYLRGRGMLGSIHKKCGNQYWYWAYKSKFNSFYYGTIIANTESLWYWARSRGTGSICRAAASVVSVSVCSRVIILLYLLLQFPFPLWPRAGEAWCWWAVFCKTRV